MLGLNCLLLMLFSTVEFVLCKTYFSDYFFFTEAKVNLFLGFSAVSNTFSGFMLSRISTFDGLSGFIAS